MRPAANCYRILSRCQNEIKNHASVRWVYGFVGGTIVHITAVFAALLLGPRKGFGTSAMPPHNMTMTVTGRHAPGAAEGDINPCLGPACQ